MDAARFQNLRLDTRSRSTIRNPYTSQSALTEGFRSALTRLDNPANAKAIKQSQMQASEKQVLAHQVMRSSSH